MAASKPAPKGPRRTAEDEKYPNIAAERDWDKEQHIKKGIESGLGRKEATRHAEKDIRED